MKNVSTAEASPTRSEPLPMEVEEAREEKEGGMVAVGQGYGCGGLVHHITLNFYLKYYNELNCLSFIL